MSPTQKYLIYVNLLKLQKNPYVRYSFISFSTCYEPIRLFTEWIQQHKADFALTREKRKNSYIE